MGNQPQKTIAARLHSAWQYSESAGSFSKRLLVFPGWIVGKVVEVFDDAWYRHIGLDTGGRDFLRYGEDSPLSGFVAIQWRWLRQMFDGESIKVDDVILDYGSGKGRAAIWLAIRFQVRQVIGVELDESLCEIAKKNCQRIRGRLACEQIDFICTNAMNYEVPDDVTVVFMFNPFRGDVFQHVLDQIRASLARSRRTIRLYYCHPVMHNMLVEAGFSVERSRSKPPASWTIYKLTP